MSLWRQRGSTLVAIGVLAALGAWSFSGLEVETEITHFLPASEDRELAHIAREMASSDLNRSVMLVLRADDEATTLAAARDLAARLRALEVVESVGGGIDAGAHEDLYALYFERRFGFYTDDPAHLALSDEDLRAHARALKTQLVSPAGAFIRRIAPRDPLLAFLRQVERLEESRQGGLRVVDGQLLTDDGRAVIFLASRGSPFEATTANALARGIDHAIAEVRATHGRTITVEQSGLYRFAIASEAAITADITRISIFSTLGVVALFLLVFRSPRYLLLGAVPLGCGFVAGLTATHLAFGSIHGLSLAFGATLIGVAIDYVVHVFNHHTLSPARAGPFASVRAITPGLLLAAATTTAGICGLMWTDFPGIRELALFTSVALVVALLATLFLMPPWMPAAPTATQVHRALAALFGRLFERVQRSRALVLVPPMAALTVAVIGLTQLEWVDDVRALNTLDPELLAEDERVREAVSRMDGGRFVLAWGETVEEALVRNDEVYRRLEAAREAGEVERFTSLHSLLWSASLQRRSLEALRDADVAMRLPAALTAEGFVAEGFAPFAEELRQDPPPLTWEELAASPLGDLVSIFRVDIDAESTSGESGRRVAFVTLTRGADLDALEARLSDLPGVRLFDQQRFVAGAYGRFRTRTIEMIGLGVVLMFLVVLARYRRPALALAAFLPAVLAAATSLSVLVLVGYQANLMHLVALLLVLGMGADYGVFMVESRSHPEGAGPTMVSLLLACVTTVLSFGLLAMSQNPALRALGLVTGLGVLFSLVLAPSAWLLLAKEPRP